MAFVQLGADNRVLRESIQSKLEAAKKEPCDAKLYDFDDVFYRLFIDPDDRSKLLIELTTSNWAEIRSKGAEARIKEKLGPWVTNFSDDGASFTIPLDDEKTCSKSVEIGEAFSKLRIYALGGPLYQYCKGLQSGKSLKSTFQFKLRRDTYCWIVPKGDRIAIVFGMEFPIKTDRIIGNQILTEFLEVRRQKDLQAAPVIAYSRDAPNELKGCKIPSFDKQAFLGYFTILLLPSHVKPKKLEVAVENVIGFRAYLTYHIKCAKAFFHQSMRRRVKIMLQILNRARYEPDDKRFVLWEEISTLRKKSLQRKKKTSKQIDIFFQHFGLSKYAADLKSYGLDSFKIINEMVQEDDILNEMAQEINIKQSDVQILKNAINCVQNGTYNPNKKQEEFKYEYKKIEYDDKKNENQRENTKTIIFIGESGVGKTTVINSMCNYLYNIKYNNKFRYKLIYENEKKEHQTQNINKYYLNAEDLSKINYSLTIIDTPGKIIKNELKECLNKNKSIDAIYFVIKATDTRTRLSNAQKDIVEKLFNLFDDSCRENIFILFTFSDGSDPPAIKLIEKLNIKYNKYFKINNSGFDFPENNDEYKKEQHKMYFNLGMKQFDMIFNELIPNGINEDEIKNDIMETTTVIDDDDTNIVNIESVCNLLEICNDGNINNDKYNEMAQLSIETMKKNNLQNGYLLVQNVFNNAYYCKILMLTENKDIQIYNRLYINKTTMDNLGLNDTNINTQLRITNINDINVFRAVKRITILQYGDEYGENRSKMSTYKIQNEYIKPYFNNVMLKDRNIIVKIKNNICIKQKKFHIFHLELEERKELNELKWLTKDIELNQFGLITKETIIEYNDTPLKNNKYLNLNSTQLLVKQIDELKLDFEYNNTVIITCDQMTKLCLNRGDIIYIKGNKGKILYCCIDMISDAHTGGNKDIIYINKTMQKNLRVEADRDLVLISINRTCKKIKRQICSRLYVSPILCNDEYKNNKMYDNDYDNENILKTMYLEPYFNNKFEKNIVISENYIFEAKHVKDMNKKIEFFVMEVEANGDEDFEYCIINYNSETNKTLRIECDMDGIDENEVYNLFHNEIDYKDIGDCEKQIKQIKNIINLSLRNPLKLFEFGLKPTKGILLYGPSGTGKTLLTKAIKSEENLCTISVNASNILSSEIGESARKLKKYFKHIYENGSGIIFIDEIDSIMCHNNIKSALISLMDNTNNGGVLVIGITNKINNIDVALRRGGLFSEEIQFNIPNKDGRRKILNILTSKIKNIDESILEFIAEKTHGFVGADLDQLLNTAIKIAITYDENHENIKLKRLYFIKALDIIAPSCIKDIAIIEKPNVEWTDIGGMDVIKKTMVEMIENPLNYGYIYESHGCIGSRGCLLWGPPGTGKTMLAKAIATKCGTNFIYIRGPELLSKYHGESEQNIRNLFRKARSAAPTILFFDEIDALAPIRGASGNSISDRVVNQLLTEMDGINKEKSNKEKQIFYLGATNRPDIIDPALKRPGRLEQMIFIGLPDKKARYEIMKNLVKDKEIFKFEEKECDTFAEYTKHFSGADIKNIIDKAKYKAINEYIIKDKLKVVKELKMNNYVSVSVNMITQIIKESKPSVTIFERKKYENMKKKYENECHISQNPANNEEKVNEVQELIFKIFDTNKLKAQTVYNELEKCGYNSYKLLLNTNVNELDELCNDIGIQYVFKIHFINEIIKLRNRNMDLNQQAIDSNKTNRIKELDKPLQELLIKTNIFLSVESIDALVRDKVTFEEIKNLSKHDMIEYLKDTLKMSPIHRNRFINFFSCSSLI